MSERGIKAPVQRRSSATFPLVWKMSSACRNPSEEARDTLIYIYAQARHCERGHRLGRSGDGKHGRDGPRTWEANMPGIHALARAHVDKTQIWHSFRPLHASCRNASLSFKDIYSNSIFSPPTPLPPPPRHPSGTTAGQLDRVAQSGQQYFSLYSRLYFLYKKKTKTNPAYKHLHD